MYPIQYGKCSLDSFINTTRNIIHDETNSSLFAVAKKINQTFFGGGPFANKSLKNVLSIEYPQVGSVFLTDHDQRLTVAIHKDFSFGSFLGYAEGIPLIGSALAVISTLGNAYLMLYDYLAFKHAAFSETQLLARSQLRKDRTEQTDIHRYARRVFNHAVDFTLHQNLLTASVLSIIPFAKPAFRAAQILNHHSERTGLENPI